MKSTNILILIFSTLFYFWFAIDRIVEPTNIKFFGNDFSLSYAADWFYYQLKVSSFIFFIALIGIIGKTKFSKKVLYAICLDSMIAIPMVLIYGYNEPIYIALIANIIPYSYIIYSYFVYARLD